MGDDEEDTVIISCIGSGGGGEDEDITIGEANRRRLVGDWLNVRIGEDADAAAASGDAASGDDAFDDDALDDDAADAAPFKNTNISSSALKCFRSFFFVSNRGRLDCSLSYNTYWPLHKAAAVAW